LQKQEPLAPMTISLGQASPPASCGQPGSVERAAHSLLSLAPGGGCLAAQVALRAGELLPHLFTLTPPPEGGGALCLCGPIRRVAPTRVLPGAVLCGVRTFLQPNCLPAP
jgi:hypothetical protein